MQSLFLDIIDWSEDSSNDHILTIFSQQIKNWLASQCRSEEFPDLIENQ